MPKTYRIRVTEYTDITAENRTEALRKFHDELVTLLAGGNELDTDVTIVERKDGDETETAAE